MPAHPLIESDRLQHDCDFESSQLATCRSANCDIFGKTAALSVKYFTFEPFPSHPGRVVGSPNGNPCAEFLTRWRPLLRPCENSSARLPFPRLPRGNDRVSTGDRRNHGVENRRRSAGCDGYRRGSRAAAPGGGSARNERSITSAAPPQQSSTGRGDRGSCRGRRRSGPPRPTPSPASPAIVRQRTAMQPRAQFSEGVQGEDRQIGAGRGVERTLSRTRCIAAATAASSAPVATKLPPWMSKCSRLRPLLPVRSASRGRDTSSSVKQACSPVPARAGGARESR